MNRQQRDSIMKEGVKAEVGRDFGEFEITRGRNWVEIAGTAEWEGD